MVRNDPVLGNHQNPIPDEIEGMIHMVCTLSAGRIYVLTIQHGSMDLPSRLAELEPQLLAEAELLRRALDKNRGGR